MAVLFLALVFVFTRHLQNCSACRVEIAIMDFLIAYSGGITSSVFKEILDRRGLDCFNISVIDQLIRIDFENMLKDIEIEFSQNLTGIKRNDRLLCFVVVAILVESFYIFRSFGK